MKKIPEEVLEFAKENNLTNIEPHPFWYKRKYKNYRVYTSVRKDNSEYYEWILTNQHETRTPTIKEFEELFLIFV